MSAVPQFPAPMIRPLRLDDLDALVALETASYPFPWTRGIFFDCLKVGCPAFGLQAGRALAGYVIYSWGAGESHLLNLCVAPEWRRRGLGSMLLEHAIDHAAARGCTRMFLEVRPSNPSAERLYLRRGFRMVGRRPGYYPAEKGREDALVMELALEAPEPTD